MLYELFDFEMERSGLQALGFYMAFLVTFMVMGLMISLGAFTLFNPASAEASKMTAVHIGKAVAFVGANILSLAIGIRKVYRFHYKTILMMFLSGLLSVAMGSLGGLIPVAVFTTFKKVGPGLESGDSSNRPS